MAYYPEDAIADSAVSLKRWLLPAVALSLAFHAGLFYYFSNKALERFAQSDAPRLVPRVFNVNRLQVDPKLLQSDSRAASTSAKSPGDSSALKNIAQFDGSFEKDIRQLRATPEANSTDIPQIKEKPSIDTRAAQALAAKARAESAAALERELSDVRQQLLSDKPDVPNRPKIVTGNRHNPDKTEESPEANLSGNDGIPAGFSNLDELLSASGRVSTGTAPIMMPTDLLFDYDSANLREGATANLQKLGRLIQRNPQSIFKVEGHTDSFGSDQYNLDLSQRRAETVKAWLVANMGIDPDRVQTQGYGKSRLLVPGDHSVEEQQLNRRVEIVIRTKKG